MTALFHVNPLDVDEDGVPRASPDAVELHKAGALLLFEGLSSLGALLSKPFDIVFPAEPLKPGEEAPEGQLSAQQAAIAMFGQSATRRAPKVVVAPFKEEPESTDREPE